MDPQVINLPEGVSVSKEELKKIDDALAALAKDNHAPRKLSIDVTLHVHNEYPRTVYKGKESRNVANAEAEAAAAKDGFGKYDHEAFTEA